MDVEIASASAVAFGNFFGITYVFYCLILISLGILVWRAFNS